MSKAARAARDELRDAAGKAAALRHELRIAEQARDVESVEAVRTLRRLHFRDEQLDVAAFSAARRAEEILRDVALAFVAVGDLELHVDVERRLGRELAHLDFAVTVELEIAAVRAEL